MLFSFFKWLAGYLFPCCSFLSCSVTPAAFSTRGTASSTAPLTAPATAAESTLPAAFLSFVPTEDRLPPVLFLPEVFLPPPFLVVPFLLAAFLLVPFLAVDFFDGLACDFFAPPFLPPLFLPPLADVPFLPDDFDPPPDDDFFDFLLAFLVAMFFPPFVLFDEPIFTDKLPNSRWDVTQIDLTGKKRAVVRRSERVDRFEK